jgi:hypothetical protein
MPNEHYILGKDTDIYCRFTDLPKLFAYRTIVYMSVETATSTK